MDDQPVSVAEFSLDDFASADTADMVVMVGGRPTSWIWTFAGPGHPRTIEQSNRQSRQRLQDDRLKQQAVVNGKKWKAPDETVETIRERNIADIVERLLGWSPVKIDGQDVPFSPEKAKELLSDRRRASLLLQAIEFLADDQAFTKRSETN